MKPNIEACRKLAESIVVAMYESGFDFQLEDAIEFSKYKITDQIDAHDCELLARSHYEHVEAVKRCGE